MSKLEALSAAVMLHQHKPDATHEHVVSAAAAFHTFLNGDAVDPQPSATPAATRPRGRPPGSGTQTQAGAEKAQAAAITTPAKPAQAKEPDKQELVGKAIADLIAANKRDEATALLGEFPNKSGEGAAKSKSSLRAEDYDSFLQKAADLLLSA